MRVILSGTRHNTVLTFEGETVAVLGGLLQIDEDVVGSYEDDGDLTVGPLRFDKLVIAEGAPVQAKPASRTRRARKSEAVADDPPLPIYSQDGEDDVTP